ncbi:MAG: hypothetical protein ABR508_03115 [Candidatus Baltobacteraceae bacterium]
MKSGLALSGLAFTAAAVLAACAGSGGRPPVPNGAEVSRQSYTQNGSTLTISGPITAIISSTEFSVNAGTGCGSMHVYTTSSTTYSPSGAKPLVGENSTDTGSGSCATSLTASGVTITSTPAPSASVSPTPLPASYTIGGGEIFGLDGTFNPADGDSATGAQSQTVDGMPCATTMPNAYHVHAFVGIVINGRQYAIPDGIGMYKPGGDITYAGFPNWTEYATCYYYMHTHDASGVMHVESPQSVALTTSIYNLRNFFDVWGQPVSATQIGPFSGTVTAYVAQVPLKTARILTSYYTTYTGDPGTIPMKSHTTIWLQIGPKIYAPSQLPVLNYYEEY